MLVAPLPDKLDRLGNAGHRAELLEDMLRQTHLEVLPARRMKGLLQRLADALRADGAAILDHAGDAMHQAGQAALPPGLTEIIGVAAALTPVHRVADGQSVLAFAMDTSPGGRVGLCAWRTTGAGGWSPGEAQLLAATAAVAGLIVEHEAMQLELARQTRNDRLTGLLNRRSFLEEAARRIDRLEFESHSGTLLILDVDGLRRLNKASGTEAGDLALIAAARVLRRSVRGTDLVARLGGGEFALWLDGSDGLAAAERAEQFRTEAPHALAEASPLYGPHVTLSIGLAERHPLHAETLEEVMSRAYMALQVAKADGGRVWRMSQHGRMSQHE